MGRPRKFSEDGVLEAATREFRIHGFADTSTERLCEVSGMGRGSLYNTFTSKEELFVRALERYVETTGALRDACLEDGSLSGADRIRTLLDRIVDEESLAAAEGHAAGCLTVVALLPPELREREPRIGDLLDRDLDYRLRSLAATISIGQADGSLRRGIDPLSGAWLVITLISGIRVSAQAGATPPVLRTVAHAGLAGLLTSPDAAIAAS